MLSQGQTRPLSTSIRFTASETAIGYDFLSKDIIVSLESVATPVDTGSGVAGSITAATAGVFQEGVTLIAGAITGDPDGNGTPTAYQWYLNNTAITGATSSTYTTTATGAGTYKVAITYTDDQGFEATVESPEQIIAKVSNGTGTAGVITGNAAFNEGVILTAPAITGDPDGNGTITAYQWFLNNTAITDATSSTYDTTPTGSGIYKVAITYTDDQSFEATVESPEQMVAKINNGNGTAGAITGNGAFNEGVILTAGGIIGDPDGNGTITKYQWYLNNTAITDATSSTYDTTPTGFGTYKVAVIYTDAQGFTATVESPEQVVAKVINAPTTLTGTAFTINNPAYPETVATLNGSPDFVQIEAPVSVTVNATSTETWSSRYVAHNVGSTLQPGTGQKINLYGLGRYSFVATSIPEATTAIVLEQNKNTAFFLHDAYSAFYDGLELTTDFTGRQSTARVLDVDVIKMGSAGGTSIVDLTSKDYITGAVTVYGADQGRSVFWGTDADDTFISGGGDSVVFGGGGFNQSQLGAGRDVLQFRSLVDSGNLIEGFDPAKDVIELWQEQGEVTNAPVFTSIGNSTQMLWGNNLVEFAGLTDLNAQNILIATQFA